MSGILAAIIAMGQERIVLGTSQSAVSNNTGGTATVQFRLNADGTISKTSGSNVLVGGGDWVSPKVNMSNYEVSWALVSGTSPSTNPGAQHPTYFALSAARTWAFSVSGGSSGSSSITLRIRRIGTSTDLATCTLTMDANS